MNREEVKNKVYELFLTFGEDINSYEKGEETNLTDDLCFSGLDEIEFTYEVEDEFALEISDDDLEKLNTVKDFIDYVHEKIKDRP